MSDHECETHYGDDGRPAPMVCEPHSGFTAKEWHAEAIADTGVSYHPVGRQYVVACGWCRCVFIADTKAKALSRFRQHEREMIATGDAK